MALAPRVDRPSLPTRLDLEARKVLPASTGSALLAYDSLSSVAVGLAEGTDRIELYTESYASGYANDPAAAIAPFRLAAQAAADAGLGINAGHDLNLHNLRYFHQHIPNLLEVSIGHALISDALYMGLEKTIQSYLEALR